MGGRPDLTLTSISRKGVYTVASEIRGVGGYALTSSAIHIVPGNPQNMRILFKDIPAFIAELAAIAEMYGGRDNKDLYALSMRGGSMLKQEER